MRSTRTPAYRHFLRRLIAARVERGLKQEDVARLLCIPQSTVSRMETGERRIDIIEAAAFARLYHKPLTYFAP